MDEKITIDKDTLKAIASDSRLNILKLLDKRKKTLSDLSTELKLSNPTIKEHLDVLSKAGLVNKEESLRKWKYYSLTFKGKQLLKPNETKLFLALVLTIIGATIFGLYLFISKIGIIGSNKMLRTTQTDLVIETAMYSTSSIENVSTINTNNLILSLLILIIIILFFFYIKEKRRIIG